VPSCKKSGWNIFRVYHDVISGKEEKHLAFDQMYCDAQMMKFNTVVFKDLALHDALRCSLKPDHLSEGWIPNPFHLGVNSMLSLNLGQIHQGSMYLMHI